MEPVTRLAAFLKRRRIPPYASVPAVLVECWLAEWVRTAQRDTRRDLVEALGSLELILTLSRNQIDILVDAGFPEEKVDTIPFGCAPGLFAGPAMERDLDIVAVGFDHGRDYRTFFEGVRDLDAQVHLLCQPANVAGLDIPDNVVVHGVIPFADYRAVLRRAKIVAVPTRELAYPTGQSVALDAAASGAALAFTGTTPMREYFDESCAAPVAPSDPIGWRTTLRALLSDDNARECLAVAGHERVLARFTYDHMWGAFRDRLALHGLPAVRTASTETLDMDPGP